MNFWLSTCLQVQILWDTSGHFWMRMWDGNYHSNLLSELQIDQFMMSTCCDGCDGDRNLFRNAPNYEFRIETRCYQWDGMWWGYSGSRQKPSHFWSFLLMKIMTAQWIWGKPIFEMGIWGVWCWLISKSSVHVVPFTGDDQVTEVLLSCHFTFKVGSL